VLTYDAGGSDMSKKSLFEVAATAAMALALGAASTRTATAADKPAAAAKAAKPDKAPAAKASAEVTLKGDLVCAKCNLKESDTCQNVLKVKDVKYYLAKNDVAEKNHEAVCSGSKPATVTGKVSEEGTKKILTASAIKLD